MKQKPLRGILADWHTSKYNKYRVVGTLVAQMGEARKDVTEGNVICTSAIILMERRKDGLLWVETENSKYILL